MTWVRGIAAVLATAAVAGSVGAVAAPPAEQSAPPASVALLTTSQSSMVRAGYVRVRVRARKAGAIRLLAMARSGGRLRALAGARLLRFRHRGAKVVHLRLTRFGKAAARSCDPLRMSANARSRTRHARRSKRLKSSVKRGTRDAKLCAAKGKGTTPPGGSAQGGSPAQGIQPLGAIDTSNADRCDFLDPSVCLYPWPNDEFTTPAATPTGRKLNINSQSTPTNRADVHIDVTDQNRADGFSPGNLIVTKVPGLDNQEAFDKTGAVPIWDMAQTYRADQPVVVINAQTKERQLIWAEIDSNPANPADRTLIIRPGTNFDEGGHYIVALRNLRDKNGNLLKPREEFRAYRDDLHTQDAALEARRAHFEDLFATLADAGIERNDLYLAWDFTVASRQSLTDRMLAIRDNAFGEASVAPLPPTITGGLGDSNLADLTVQGDPPVTVGPPSVTDFTPEQDSKIARQVEGKLYVPCYLSPNCNSGSQFLLDSNGLPTRTALPHQASFTCNIPRVAFSDSSPGDTRISLYGHGLLGSRGEVNQGQLKDFAQEHNIVFCATEWSGMACGNLPDQPGFDPENPQGQIQSIFNQVLAGTFPAAPDCDIPTVLAILQDLSNFPKLADRVQQGMLDFLYLGRLMRNPAGFNSLAAFKDGATPILDTQRLYYDGNSQGGIIGGSLAAVSVDNDRATLGVPGMNYSTLLSRSVDFDTYAQGNFEGVETDAGLYDNYPNELERPLNLSLIQLLWDRAEADGYAAHMTSDPLPNTPAHKVMLHVGFGDHQVADVTPEVEARTIGAHINRPVLDTARPRFFGRPAAEKSSAFFGIPSLTFPWNGSALVYWDIGPLRSTQCAAGETSCGVAPAPANDIPNRQGDDPHEFPRRSPLARQMKSDFLKPSGQVTDVCHGPCHAGSWP